MWFNNRMIVKSDSIKDPKKKILIVKLSSLGDVLHTLPIIFDIRTHLPSAQIDWLVEEAYVDLLKPLQADPINPYIDQVIPFGLRRWKKNIFSKTNWVELIQLIRKLRANRYDLIIDFQGLIKSALIAALARSNSLVIGPYNSTDFSSYEPLARQFYSQTVAIPKQCHAIEVARYLINHALGIQSNGTKPHFYSVFEQCVLPDMFIESKPYALCFHATARHEKRWGMEAWVEIGKYLFERGITPIYPWGNTEEKAISETIVRQIPGAVVPQVFSLRDYFEIIQQARLTIGVDTGLTHLAAVLYCPTIELYCDSPIWKTRGYWSDSIINLGDLGAPPDTISVKSAIDQLTQEGVNGN
jgi:heptosyltransferase-1